MVKTFKRRNRQTKRGKNQKFGGKFKRMTRNIKGGAFGMGRVIFEGDTTKITKVTIKGLSYTPTINVTEEHPILVGSYFKRTGIAGGMSGSYGKVTSILTEDNKKPSGIMYEKYQQINEIGDFDLELNSPKKGMFNQLNSRIGLNCKPEDAFKHVTARDLGGNNALLLKNTRFRRQYGQNETNGPQPARYTDVNFWQNFVLLSNSDVINPNTNLHLIIDQVITMNGTRKPLQYFVTHNRVGSNKISITNGALKDQWSEALNEDIKQREQEKGVKIATNTEFKIGSSVIATATGETPVTGIISAKFDGPNNTKTYIVNDKSYTEEQLTFNQVTSKLSVNELTGFKTQIEKLLKVKSLTVQTFFPFEGDESMSNRYNDYKMRVLAEIDKAIDLLRSPQTAPVVENVSWIENIRDSASKSGKSITEYFEDFKNAFNDNIADRISKNLTPLANKLANWSVVPVGARSASGLVPPNSTKLGIDADAVPNYPPPPTPAV